MSIASWLRRTATNGRSSGEGPLTKSQLKEALRGVQYPAQRAQLISHAKGKAATSAIITALQYLPPGEYRQLNAVVHAVRGMGFFPLRS